MKVDAAAPELDAEAPELAGPDVAGPLLTAPELAAPPVIAPELAAEVIAPPEDAAVVITPEFTADVAAAAALVADELAVVAVLLEPQAPSTRAAVATPAIMDRLRARSTCSPSVLPAHPRTRARCITASPTGPIPAGRYIDRWPAAMLPGAP